MALARPGENQFGVGKVDKDSDLKNHRHFPTSQNFSVESSGVHKKPQPVDLSTNRSDDTRNLAPRPKPKPRPSLPNLVDSNIAAHEPRTRTHSVEAYSSIDLPHNLPTNSTGFIQTHTITDSTPVPNDYSYASVEFRPLIVTNDGAYSGPVTSNSNNMEAEKIRACSDSSIKSNHCGGESRTANFRPPYSVVDLTGREDNTIISTHTSDPVLRPVPPIPNDSDLYDSVADLVSKPCDVESLYAKVDKSHKFQDDSDAQHPTSGDTNVVGRSMFFVNIPPKRDPGSPPQVPKPYDAADNFRDISQGVPDQVRERLDSFGRNSISTEDLMGAYVTVDAKFESKKNHSCDQLDVKSQPATTISRNDKKSFEKKHRRMRSHEKVVKLFNIPPLQSSSNRTKDTDSTNNLGRRSSGSSSTVSSASPDPPPLINPSPDLSNYKEIDTNEMYKRVSGMQSDDLPEGWQKVENPGELYYWHLWSGTIQYERPVATTPSSSSRPVSPDSSIEASSSSSSTFDFATEKSRSTSSESPQEKTKQVISFPVHSMGWITVEESEVAPKVLSETVNQCLTLLAEKRNDLWNTSETWGNGRDIKLNLDGESLKLYDPKQKEILLVQPITKMRVWGVGKDEQRDFAYIARNTSSEKHKCHMFRCHGNVSGRSITNALQTICSRVLEEKRKAKERSENPVQQSGSNLLLAPLSPSVKVSAAFNEKPHVEDKKRFTAKYLGWTEVVKSSGIDVLNKAVTKLTSSRLEVEWKTVLIEVTTSEIKTTDCLTQSVLMEDRIRYLSFFGVSRDERMCGYIVSASPSTFLCHIFYCTPHSGAITMALEEACKLRFEKVLDRQVVEEERKGQPQANISRHGGTRESMKGKGIALKNSVQGLFSKLQKRDSRKKEDEKKITPDIGSKEYPLKYFGCVQVTIGTGVDTIEKSVESLSSGSMIIGILEVTSAGLTFFDSQRTALSRRLFDLDTITFCELTSDKHHFGIILSQGRGKYVCHVFQQYRDSLSNTVKAILEML